MKESSDLSSETARSTAPFSKIGIVTVTYNSGAVLQDFFKSIDSQSCSDFIVVAVDNASTDDTLNQLRIWGSPKLVLIANAENQGVAAGNNRGIRAALEAGCDYILLVNNDVVFGPELLQHLLAGLIAQSCDLTTPLIYFNDAPNTIWAAGGEFQPFWGYRVQHLGENEIDVGQYDRPHMIQYAPTCCVLIRKEVFDRIGLMDERYFVYSDDVDFMYRALHAGLTMFLIPEAKLWHKINALTGGKHSDFTLYYATRGRTLFLSKHLGRIRGTLWTWLYLIFYWLKPLFGRDTWPRARIRQKGTCEGKKIGLEKLDNSAS
jgi:GT2 family glycosyltransferase